MRVYVHGDEWFPNYSIQMPINPEEEYGEDELIELDDDFLKRFKEAETAYIDLHRQLSKKVDEFYERKREKQREAERKIRGQEHAAKHHARKEKNKERSLAVRKDHLERHWPLCSSA